jgi:hypothetical protein
MSSVLQGIQTDAANALVADPFFAIIPVLSERLGDLGSAVDLAVNQAAGVCAVVSTPLADVEHPGQPGPYFDRIHVRVRVYENVTLNQGLGGTGVGALEIAENVLRVLHHHRPAAVNEVLTAARPTIALGREAALPDALVYDVALTTQGGLGYSVASLDAPVLGTSGGTVTISAATSGGTPVPGAAIFYTTDGSQPAPRNGTLYTGPFASAGQAVKASAWLAGYQTSPVTTLQT